MSNKEILLVEDNPDDVELILLALKAKRIVNKVIVAIIHEIEQSKIRQELKESENRWK